jgi:hypothetical protein
VQDTDVVALPKPWFENQREDFNTFRFHFVGKCMALVVTETPRKPMVEQVDAFTEINGPAPPQRRTCHFDKGTGLTGWSALS